MPPCVDAQLVLAPRAVAALLQLPPSWRVPAMRVRDGMLEVDVVFPEGPSEEPPILLVPYYRRLYTESGPAQLLDRVEVIAATPDRPVRERRHRRFMADWP